LILANLPWRFMSGAATGLLAMWLYHSAVVSGINEAVALERQKAAEMAQLDAWVLQKRVEAIDEKYTKELSDAQEENSRLAADLAAGRKRLSIAASCPKLPELSGSGVGNGAIAILSRESESAYLAHRELIAKKDAQIKVLQGVIREMKSPR
jgi:prophage endopeptidase